MMSEHQRNLSEKRQETLTDAGWVVESGFPIVKRGSCDSNCVHWWARKGPVTVVFTNKWVRVSTRGNPWTDVRTPLSNLTEGQLSVPGDYVKNVLPEEAELKSLLTST